MTLVERVKAPIPKFFKVLRTVGIVLAAVGGAILASPVALPAAVVTVGGYMVVAGSVASTVAQTTVDGEKTNLPNLSNE